MKKLFTLFLCSLGFISFGQSGTFDPDFDGDGKVLSNFSIAEDANMKIVCLPSGKIITGGYQSISGDNDFVLTCYNPDGSLDAGFGTSGSIAGDNSLSNDGMNSFAVQADGKIVCVGYSGGLSMDSYNIAIMRFNANGQGLDNTFGPNGNGKIVIDVNGGTDEAYDVAIQPDGKILVAGYADMGVSNNSYESLVYRFNTDGTLDNTFSFDGKVVTTVSSSIDLYRKILLQPDGKIVCIGFGSFTSLDATVVRYNADGTLDNSFGSSGKVITDFTNGNTERIYGGSLQPDGKIVVVGHAHIGSDDDFLVARYNSDGTLDNTFVNAGYRTIDFGLTDDYCNASYVQSDGMVLLVGTHDATTEYAAVCYRLKADGTTDGTFSGGMGYMINDIIAEDSDSYASVDMQSDGKIVICGTSIPTASSDYTKFVVRILSGLTIGVAEFTQAETAPLLYPNPVQEIETLKYTLTENQTVTITLTDATGKLVKTFVENEAQTKGDQKVELTMPANLASGNYVLTIASPKGKISIKIQK